VYRDSSWASTRPAARRVRGHGAATPSGNRTSWPRSELTCVDQAHEQVTHLSAVQRLMEQRILPMQHSSLQCLLADVVIQRGSRMAQESGQSFPVPQQISDRFAQTRVGLCLLLRKLRFQTPTQASASADDETVRWDVIDVNRAASWQADARAATVARPAESCRHGVDAPTVERSASPVSDMVPVSECGGSTPRKQSFPAGFWARLREKCGAPSHQESIT